MFHDGLIFSVITTDTDAIVHGIDRILFKKRCRSVSVYASPCSVVPEFAVVPENALAP